MNRVTASSSSQTQTSHRARMFRAKKTRQPDLRMRATQQHKCKSKRWKLLNQRIRVIKNNNSNHIKWKATSSNCWRSTNPRVYREQRCQRLPYKGQQHMGVPMRVAWTWTCCLRKRFPRFLHKAQCTHRSAPRRNSGLRPSRRNMEEACWNLARKASDQQALRIAVALVQPQQSRGRQSRCQRWPPRSD